MAASAHNSPLTPVAEEPGTTPKSIGSAQAAGSCGFYTECQCTAHDCTALLTTAGLCERCVDCEQEAPALSCVDCAEGRPVFGGSEFCAPFHHVGYDLGGISAFRDCPVANPGWVREQRIKAAALDLYEAAKTTADNIRHIGQAGALYAPYSVWLAVVEAAIAKADGK